MRRNNGGLTVATVSRLYSALGSTMAVAAELGCSHMTVGRFMRRNGIARKPWRRIRHPVIDRVSRLALGETIEVPNEIAKACLNLRARQVGVRVCLRRKDNRTTWCTRIE